MSCIKREMIQKYIDEETTDTEIKMIESHILSCESCRLKLDERKQMIHLLLQSMETLVNKPIEIPALQLPHQLAKKSFGIKKILFALSAASVFLLFLITHHSTTTHNTKEVIIIHSIDEDVDANLPIYQQSVTINVINSQGNTLEHF